MSKVKTHNDYLDMISAYADGELLAADSRELEEHIGTCEQCSALLVLYREISTAAAESTEPAPPALLTGVMNAVSVINTQERTDTRKKRPPRRIFLTRLMPIAACLVVALLVWGYFGDFLRVSYDEAAPEAAGGGMSSMNSAADVAEDSPQEVQSEGDIPAGAPSQNNNATGGGQPRPDGGFDGDSMMTDDAFVQSEPSATMPPQDSADAGASSADEEIILEMLFDAAHNSAARGGSIDEQDTEFIEVYLLNASHLITVTGEFPEVLSAYKPEDIETRLGWEQTYIIPSTDVPTLQEQLKEFDVFNAAANTSVNMMSNSVDGTYAVVLYSPEG